MRLIDADALLDKIKNLSGDRWDCYYNAGIADVVEYIVNAPTIAPTKQDIFSQRWIPVGERLPEGGQLVTICNIKDMEAVYEPRNQFYPWHLTDQGGAFFTGGQFVTHWMPVSMKSKNEQ